ncbi:MAG TPA: IS1 family transposase [Terriglobia bacterium]|nr:IS1 family transposase [Terriglobia bacterium]
MQIHCPFCQLESYKTHQTNGHACNTIYRCMNCDRFFSERRFTGYSGLKLAPEKIVQIVNCLVEGVSIRATSRLVGVEKKTVTRIMLHAAERCQRVMDERIVNLHSRYYQADEIWCFTGKKEQNCTFEDKHNGHHLGDTWVFLVTDADTKLVPNFVVSPDRGLRAAQQLMTDLASRLAVRPHISTDGLRSYIWGVERAFGSEADYGMLIKSYAEHEGYMELTGARPRPVSGRPELENISTSYAERNNLNCRTFMRRLTRLTNAFSKRIENLTAALWIYFSHYNFVRVHGSLRVTPAMAAGVTDHVWEIEELLSVGQAVSLAA